MEETDFNIGQLRRPACKGRRNEETGDRRPAEAQLTRPRRKMAIRRNARPTYTWSHEASVDRALHMRMVKGAGNTAGELRTAGPSLNMLNRKRSGCGPSWAHVAALTSGRILVHNLLRASTQVLHTYSRE